jgi:integrase
MGVRVRQRKKGKGEPWWVLVAHHNRRLYRKVGAKRAAEEVAAKIQARLALGEFDIEAERRGREERREPTFGEYAQEWLAVNVPARCREGSVGHMAALLRNHVLPAFGPLRLSEVTRGRIRDFIDAKVLAGRAPSTVNHMRAVVSGVLNKAVENELIAVNPALRLGRIKRANGAGDGENRNIDPLTREEARALLAAALAYFKRHHALVLLLLRTGLRIGEALALRWGDVDFHGRFIHVQRGLSRGRLQATKSGRDRRVDMSPQLTQTLAAHLAECKRKGLALGLGGAPEYVFTNEAGKVLSADNWRKRVWWKLLARAGLRRVRIHDLRHTYATLRLSKGDNVTDVSKQLGHASVKLTLDVYNHWVPGSKKSEVDGLDDEVPAPGGLEDGQAPRLNI